ncbi:hypothetical protein V6U90_25135 [Micromonospora sp. CPCC 206060]|uniref:hypothetical protein n=1 Tax=Micromonospora sp. CPCC 206060 TaxID=3122406 RepID=UPI002FF2A2C8
MVVTAAERRALAGQVAARLAGTPGVTDAFLTGSLLVGLGNRTSDVDLYLLGPDIAPGRHQVFAESVRIDVHRQSTAGLATTVDRVAAASLRSDAGAAVVADRDVVAALRLRCGEVVVDSGYLGTLQRRLRERDGTLRRLLLTRWFDAAHYGQEDLAGLLDDPADADAATMVARLLLRTAGKAVAAACDDLFPGEKWVWRQLDRSAPAGFPLADFRRLLRVDPLADPAGTGLTDVRRFAQTCLAAAATLGWHGVPLACWPRWQPADGSLHRPPELSVRAYVDGVVVTAPDSRRVRLSHAAALVWALCDGVDDRTLRQDTERLSRTHPVYHGLDRERTAGLVAGLVEARLVERRR